MNRNSKLKLENNAVYEIYRACRLCGAGGGYKMPIIQNIVDFQDESGLNLKQKIQECVQIEVRPGDRMPPLICELCVDKLDGFHQFLELSRQTDKRTRMRLGLPLEKPAPKGVPSAPVPQPEDDEPLLKGKKVKVKLEKVKVNLEKVKVNLEKVKEVAPPPQEPRPPPPRKDKPRSSRTESKSGHCSRSTSASSGRSEDTAREAPSRRATRNSEDAAFKSLSLRESDSPSPPPNKRATRNSYETDSNFKPSSKAEKSAKLSPKEPARPTRGTINIPKKEAQTGDAPQFLKPSPKCHKKPPEAKTTKKPELPTPKAKKPAEILTSKTKVVPPEIPKPKTKAEPPKIPTSKAKMEPPKIPTSKAKTEPPGIPTSKAKMEPPKIPTSKAKTESPLAKVVTKEMPKPKSRKRPPDNEEGTVPTPKKIKVPPPPPPPAPQYTCGVCAHASPNAQGFASHLRGHTPTYTPTKLACNACALWFATSEQASTHHKTHRGGDAYCCQRCGNTYKLHATFNDHLAACPPYTEVPDRRCDSCWRLFPTAHLMDQHRCLGEDNRPGGKCSKCSRGYALLKNLTKHESTCQHRKKGEPIVDPSVLSRIRPIQVRVSRCDALLTSRGDRTCDVSTLVGKYGLDKSCIYPYGSQIKCAPDGMVSKTDELLNAVHWDSDCTDSSDDEMSGSEVRRNKPKKLFTLALKVLFSNKCLGKVPRKIRKKIVKEADAFDLEVFRGDTDINSDIRNIIDNIGNDWNDDGEDDLFNIRGKERMSDDLDFDNIFDSLNNHDDEVGDDPKSSGSNDVSILKCIVRSKTTDEINTEICLDGLDKEVEDSPVVGNGLENDMEGSEKCKEGLDGVTDESQSQPVSEEILDATTEKSESQVTENRLEVDNDLENTAVPDVRLDERDETLESQTLSNDKIEEKSNSPPVTDKKIDKELVTQVDKDSDEMDQDVDCQSVAVAASLGEMDEHLDGSSITDGLDRSYEDLEPRNKEVTEKGTDDKDKNTESPKLSSTTDDDTVINEMCLNALENDLKNSEKRLEEKQLLKSPDKSFTQFCIDNIISNICKSNDNQRNNQNTDEAAVNVNSEDNDEASKENNTDASHSNNVYTENHTRQDITEDQDTTKLNGLTKDDDMTDKQLLESLDEQINETYDSCRKTEENNATVDTNDSGNKLGDKYKVDTKMDNVQVSDKTSMDLDNVSEDEFNFDS